MQILRQKCSFLSWTRCTTPHSSAQLIVRQSMTHLINIKTVATSSKPKPTETAEISKLKWLRQQNKPRLMLSNHLPIPPALISKGVKICKIHLTDLLLRRNSPALSALVQCLEQKRWAHLPRTVYHLVNPSKLSRVSISLYVESNIDRFCLRNSDAFARFE